MLAMRDRRDEMIIKVGTDYKRRDGFKAKCVEKGTGYHGPNSFMMRVDSGVRYPVTERGLVHLGKEADADVVGEWVDEATHKTVTLHGYFNLPGAFICCYDRLPFQDTHKMTYTTRDGEPATGRYVNEAGDVITLERLK